MPVTSKFEHEVFLSHSSLDKSVVRDLAERLKRDGLRVWFAEIFKIKDVHHASNWMAQVFPVLLVIRNSGGKVSWMEVRDWLKREGDNGKKAVKQIVFEGEPFTVTSLRKIQNRYREIS